MCCETVGCIRACSERYCVHVYVYLCVHACVDVMSKFCANIRARDRRRGIEDGWVCVYAITSSKLLGNALPATSYDIAFFTYPREKSLVTAKNFRGKCRFRGNVVRVPPCR